MTKTVLSISKLSQKMYEVHLMGNNVFLVIEKALTSDANNSSTIPGLVFANLDKRQISRHF